VVATCAEDPLNAAGLFGVDALVRDRKQVALKNLNVEDYVAGGTMPMDGAFQMGVRAPDGEDRLTDIVIHWGSLPRDTTLFVAFEAQPDGKPTVVAGARELKAGGAALDRKAEGLFPGEWEDRCGDEHRLESSRVYVLSPAEARTSVIPRVRVSGTNSLQMFVNLLVPKKVDVDTAQFDVMQRIGKEVVGGITYEVRFVPRYVRDREP
jgi:hypothetical protein